MTRPTFDELLTAASLVTGFDRSSIIGQSRIRPVVEARKLVAVLARELRGDPLSFIAQQMGKDHSTIAHGFRAYPALAAKPGAMELKNDITAAAHALARERQARLTNPIRNGAEPTIHP